MDARVDYCFLISSAMLVSRMLFDCKYMSWSCTVNLRQYIDSRIPVAEYQANTITSRGGPQYTISAHYYVAKIGLTRNNGLGRPITARSGLLHLIEGHRMLRVPHSVRVPDTIFCVTSTIISKQQTPSAPVACYGLVHVPSRQYMIVTRKVRVKCNEDDTIGDLKKLIAAQVGTRPEKIRIQKWYTVYKVGGFGIAGKAYSSTTLLYSCTVRTLL